MLETDQDQRAIQALRADASHWRRLWKDAYWCALEYRATIEILTRQLAETRDELRRLTSEACR